MSICLFLLGCGDSVNTNELTFKVYDEKTLKQILSLDENETRFFKMNGRFGAEDVEALVVIMHPSIEYYDRFYKSPDDENMIRLQIVIDKKPYMRGFFTVENLHFAFDNEDRMYIKGVWSDRIGNLNTSQHNKTSNEAAIDSAFSLSQDISTIKHIESLVGYFDASVDNGDYYKLLTQSRIICGQNIAQKVCEMMNDTLNGNKDKASIINDLMAQAKDGYDEHTQWGSTFINEAFPVYIDERVLVLLHRAYTYTGGAHGAKNISAQAFYLQNGEILSSDVLRLFKSESLEQVRALMIESLQKQYERDAFFDIDNATMPNVFFPAKEHIHFIWQEYEIAPYAMGIIELPISYNALKMYVNPQSSYYYLFQ